MSDDKMDSIEELSQLVETAEIEEKGKDINILLLGTTGVGKSTFINSIANYLTFEDLDIAKQEKLNILIPCTFKIKDKDLSEHTVKVGGEDKNEAQTVGDSATQDVKTYVFPIKGGKYMIRLIDTPGMGDTRGIQQDNVNSENILAYIGNLKHLHAICYLMKSNETRCTVFFEYCLTQIFSRLDKSATDNLIFIFTNTRGTDYNPGDTMSILEKSIDEISKRPPYVRVPTKNNVFCFENEGFKYLAAHKQNIKFPKPYEKTMQTSWTKSRTQCWKLITYIMGNGKDIPPLTPHLVQNTQAINEARRMITYLSKPLADIAQLIHQNMWVLQRHKEDVAMSNQSLAQLREKMYMPVVTLEVEDLPQPATVCTTRKCAELYKVGEVDRWHYKQRCHDPCYLKNVPKEIIGAPDLASCYAMRNKKCRKCGCYFSVHMHVYYLTREKEDRIVNNNVMLGIKTEEEAQREAQSLIHEMGIRQQEFEEEHTFIVRCSARFAHFLQNNAITPFTDSYKSYIEYLLDREKALGKFCNKNTLQSLQRLLDEYEEARRFFDLALEEDKKLGKQEQGVTSSDINSSIQELFGLKHNGQKIKELLESQQRAIKREYSNTEYIHTMAYRRQQNKKKKKEKQMNFTGDTSRSAQYQTSMPSWLPHPLMFLWDWFSNQQGHYSSPWDGFHHQGARGRSTRKQGHNLAPNQRSPYNYGPPAQIYANSWIPPPGFPANFTQSPGFPSSTPFQGFPNNMATPQGFSNNWNFPQEFLSNQANQQRYWYHMGTEQNFNQRANSGMDKTLNNQDHSNLSCSQQYRQQQYQSHDEMTYEVMKEGAWGERPTGLTLNNQSRNNQTRSQQGSQHQHYQSPEEMLMSALIEQAASREPNIGITLNNQDCNNETGCQQNRPQQQYQAPDEKNGMMKGAVSREPNIGITLNNQDCNNETGSQQNRQQQQYQAPDEKNGMMERVLDVSGTTSNNQDCSNETGSQQDRHQQQYLSPDEMIREENNQQQEPSNQNVATNADRTNDVHRRSRDRRCFNPRDMRRSKSHK